MFAKVDRSGRKMSLQVLVISSSVFAVAVGLKETSAM
jgi:hypothetical protein